MAIDMLARIGPRGKHGNPKKFDHFTRWYVVTSHAARGIEVTEVVEEAADE